MDCPSVHSFYFEYTVNWPRNRDENALQNSDNQFRKPRIASVSVVVWAEEKRNL